jgi:hypothetical protein
MDEVDEIQNLINEVNVRNYNLKDYDKMRIEELSAELREVMRFQQKSFERIEEIELKTANQDLIKYTKIICRNTIEREIIKIQETYLVKIKTEYIDRDEN